MFQIVLNCLDLSRIVSNLTDFIRIALSNSILGRSNPILDRPNGTKQDEKRQLRQEEQGELSK